jgi:hypothetical protein
VSLFALFLLAGCQQAGFLYEVPETPPSIYRWGVETGGDTTVVLGWDDWTSGEVAYVVQVQQADGTWTAVESEPTQGTPRTGTTLRTVVEGLTGETDYTFRVVAVGTVFATPSAPLSVTTGPHAPVGLSAVYNAPNVDVTWTDAASTESTYVVQRSTDGEFFSTVTTSPPGTESYQHASAPAGVYYYRVYAEGVGSNSSAPVAGPVVVP